ncbi:hypothetical protein WJX81_001101 [Elliptochloris bilobata]|uniref:Spindle and kinetochore-associated protein 1 n=1 Tax=Elliptochloris bilobata TaxID=381761 RepID=A0AAW1RMU8_9CHLO
MPGSCSSRCDQGPFEVLVGAFSARLRELQAVALLRVNEATQELFAHDLSALEACVRALEHKLQEIRNFIAHERQAIPKVEAVVEACRAQGAHLAHIAANLPLRLPGAPPDTGAAPSGSSASASEAAPAALKPQGKENVSAAGQADYAEADVAAEKKRRPPPPRRYVMADELASLSAFMTQRLTLEKVNAAVDDAAALAEGCARLLAAARAQGKLAPAERKRAQMLLVNVAGKEGVKGRYWFTEPDLKAGACIRSDKTGRALLTVLRHLGRIQEMRFNLEGSMQPVYVLR